MLSLSATAEPVRTLPAPPGQILDLRANAAGDLYVRTATKVLWMDLQHPEEGWNALALDGVVDLTENAGREVFARQDLKTRFAIHRLVGGEATLVANAPQAPYKYWYVDAAGRTWFQTDKNLLVVRKDEELLNVPAKAGPCGFSFRQPCEWQPGHVALLYGTDAVWASPDRIASAAAPPFSGDGTGNGLFRLGPQHLVGGGGNNDGRGSYRLDAHQPDKAPERLNLGWDWFRGVATAPDGRLLVLAQTDRDPQFTLFWYAADGRSQIRLKGAEDVIRSWRNQRALSEAQLVFTTDSIGFVVTGNGMLGRFTPEEAAILTEAKGLPLPRLQHVVAVGNDLILAGDGQLVVWNTTEPLQPAMNFEDRREWPLAGPCARDSQGNMWAFLLDFPGKLSRHDSEHWQHIDIELGNRISQHITGDDEGRLQIDFQDYPAGSCLVSDGEVTSWRNAPVRAWLESVKAGACFFSDGSPYRPRHLAAGKADWLWAYEGRVLWEAGREYDYYESPPYHCYWLGADGTCYRGGVGRVVWVFANGRWTETDAPPLSIGPDGIRADGPGKGRLRVVYDGQMKLPLTTAPASGKPRVLTLQGNEAFIPADDDGGWVGQYRIFRNAYYPLAGRVYPGTNGHYLVADNTLRYQPPQTLKIEGEVLADGNLRRLVCKISGSEPLYKPRILVFLDGEFADSIASPDGVDLPPLQAGLHTLEVYAADGFGMVSEQPLRLTLDGGPKFEVVHLEMGEDWMLKPQRLQVLPTMIAERSVLGRTLEIDSDGVVWILVEGGVIAIDPAKRHAAFHRCPAQELLLARGRVWACGNYDNARLQMPVYELRIEGPRHAVNLYDDLPRCAYGPQLIADPAGGIWALGHMTAVRWDGKRTQSWERSVGFNARVLPLPDGAVIQVYEDCFVYRDGELGPPIRWSTGDAYADNPLFTLGRNYLVKPRRGTIVALDNGRTLDQKSPPGESFRMDAGGNLYVWNKGRFSRFSGESLAETALAACASPGMSPNHDPGGYEFLATTNGTVVYTVQDTRVIVVRGNEGAAEYGWQHGIRPGLTHAIREAPDGRIWIMRRAQLLVYDPTQPADAIPSAWPGWRAVPVMSRFAAGAFGRVWYGDPERRGLASTDGTNEAAWAKTCNGNGGIIVGDQGVAAAFSGSDTYLLATGRAPERVQNMESAVLELVKRGAKSFDGEGAPAVAADGRVYFRSKIWDGQTWQPAPDGRASLDPRGELYLLCMEHSSLPVAYRLEGIKAIPLGQVEKCLIDAYGLRWYDAGLLEANPGCLPVWHASKEQPHVSFDVNTTRARIDAYGSLQALPLGDGQFLVRVGAKLHRLDAHGMTPIPGVRVPCGDELDPTWGLRVWRLAEGRWALAVYSRLYISPPDYHLVP
jgi:hypothetical protein